MVDCTGLENRRTERYRGFESLSLRKKSGNNKSWFLIFFYMNTESLLTSRHIKENQSKHRQVFADFLQRTPNQGWASKAKPIPTPTTRPPAKKCTKNAPNLASTHSYGRFQIQHIPQFPSSHALYNKVISVSKIPLVHFFRLSCKKNARKKGTTLVVPF